MNISTILFLLFGSILYYFFILRKYNSLGFRLFSVFTFVSILFSIWIYQDEKNISTLQKNGEHLNAMITSKDKKESETTSSSDYQITVTYKSKNGEIIAMQSNEYISEKEWNSFSLNAEIEMIYDAKSNKIFVAESVERFKKDKWILYLVTVFIFFIGCGCWFFLRKYKVGVDEKGNEWLEKEGKVFLDERENKTVQVMKRGNIISKIILAFRK